MTFLAALRRLAWLISSTLMLSLAAGCGVVNEARLPHDVAPDPGSGVVNDARIPRDVAPDPDFGYVTVTVDQQHGASVGLAFVIADASTGEEHRTAHGGTDARISDDVEVIKLRPGRYVVTDWEAFRAGHPDAAVRGVVRDSPLAIPFEVAPGKVIHLGNFGLWTWESHDFGHGTFFKVLPNRTTSAAEHARLSTEYPGLGALQFDCATCLDTPVGRNRAAALPPLPPFVPAAHGPGTDPAKPGIAVQLPKELFALRRWDFPLDAQDKRASYSSSQVLMFPNGVLEYSDHGKGVHLRYEVVDDRLCIDFGMRTRCFYLLKDEGGLSLSDASTEDLRPVTIH